MTVKKITGGLIFIFMGVILLLENFGVINFSWGALWRLWPVIFVLMGLNLFFDRFINTTIGTLLSIIIVLLALGCAAYWGIRYSCFRLECSPNGRAYEDTRKYSNENATLLSEPYESKVKKAELHISGSALSSCYLTDTTSSLLDINMKRADENYVFQKLNRDTLQVINFQMRESRRGNKEDSETFFKLNTNPTWHMYVDVDNEIGKAIFDLSKFKVKEFVIEGEVTVLNLKLGLLQSASIVNIPADLGETTIQVPLASACRIHDAGEMSSGNFNGFTKQNDGSYISTHYSENSANKIDIYLKGGKAQINRY